ncbi:MAG: methyltransferase domain-containing protein [Ruminococcaceae bacterium]|nr:methyltransferase domain-containing protein [Oscillospiraceae bacterium]
MSHHIGTFIVQKRRELGLTQQNLADSLGVSFQAVSKWETGAASPDISLLPGIARVLQTSVDALLGYASAAPGSYDQRYADRGFYWGLKPNDLCYALMKLRPPTEPLRVLDIGCGEGKDAVFLARNGYLVSAFDIAESGLAKGRELAGHCGVDVDFFRADIQVFLPVQEFDIIFSSGVLHYLMPERRGRFFERLKACTSPGGIHVLNVFVAKSFLPTAPDYDDFERQVPPWHSGELAGYYQDWYFHKCDEVIFDCESGGIPHRHCMDILIAEKPDENGYAGPLAGRK